MGNCLRYFTFSSCLTSISTSGIYIRYDKLSDTSCENCKSESRCLEAIHFKRGVSETIKICSECLSNKIENIKDSKNTSFY